MAEIPELTPEETATNIAFGAVLDEGGSLGERQDLATAIAAALRACALPPALAALARDLPRPGASTAGRGGSAEVAGMVERLQKHMGTSWRLVPVEPTAEMVSKLLPGTEALGFIRDYRAAISASPSPLDDAELVEGINRAIHAARYSGQDEARAVISYLSAHSKGETAS